MDVHLGRTGMGSPGRSTFLPGPLSTLYPTSHALNGTNWPKWPYKTKTTETNAGEIGVTGIGRIAGLREAFREQSPFGGQ